MKIGIEREQTSMTIGKKTIGETPEGLPVEEYTLSSRSGVAARVMTYGALLTSLRAPDRHGNVEEITLGFDELKGYLGEHPYFGATVGRYANRIARAEFQLGGETYRLAANNGPHHLHGGLKAFDKVVWTATEAPSVEGDAVEFSYLSPDGEEGYPGNLSVSVVYRLTDDGELAIEYEATTDKTTPINLTNHTYWNLRGAGSGDVLTHELTLSADSYLPVDGTLIPTGEIHPVAGTPMDFTTKRTIGSRIDQIEGGGYDHCYVVRRGEGDEGDSVLVGKTRDPSSGRTMAIWTTQPGVQLYTGNFLDGLRGRGGAVFEKHHGFCLETQCFPDSPHQPDFPSCLLEPGGTYRHTTRHAFSVE